jgi:DNA repair protein SbcD/Mre11
MQDFRFVHAADLHLDTPFEGLGQLAPDIAAALRDASLEAWDALVQACIDHDASCLLLAGDIYDGADRGVRAQLRLRDGLERLSQRGICTFIVHGNHDPLGGWSAIREWPEGVTVFGCDTVQSVPLVRDGQLLAVVHGISYGRRDVTENLALRFRRGPDTTLQIGLLHCSAGPQGEHAAYSPCSLDDLRRTGIDYWALGHVHSRRVLAERNPWVVYPGNLQGRSLKPSETGAKGAFLGKVSDGRVEKLTFLPLSRVFFVEIVVDIAGVSDLPALQDRLEEELERELTDASPSAVVARGRLTGRGALNADLQRRDASTELLKALRDGGERAAVKVWWSAIADDTQGEISRDQVRDRGDFSSELVGLVDNLLADSARLTSIEEQLNDELRRAAFHKHIAEVPGDVSDLLRKAEQLALDRLDEKVGR